MDLKGLSAFDNVEVDAIQLLQKELDAIEAQIRETGLTPELLGQLGSFFRIVPMSMGTNMCHQGRGAPAPQWEEDLGDITFITCGHNPAHIRIKP